MTNQECVEGALARGYCTDRNSKKVLDPDLIQDMAKEVMKLNLQDNQELRDGELHEFIVNYVLGIPTCKGQYESELVTIAWADLRHLAKAISTKREYSAELREKIITPENLHKWYLEAITNLKGESYNHNADKPYEALTEEQKFIDKYIAKALKTAFDSNQLYKE